MVALTKEIQSLGRQAMEGNLSKAAKIRRRMAAGPKLKTSRNYKSAEAVLRVIQGLARAESLLKEYELGPGDMRGALIYCQPTIGSFTRLLELTPNPRDFFERAEGVEKAGNIFLGILWQFADAEEHNVKPWIQRFMVGPEAERHFETLLEMGAKNQLN